MNILTKYCTANLLIRMCTSLIINFQDQRAGAKKDYLTVDGNREYLQEEPP